MLDDLTPEQADALLASGAVVAKPGALTEAPVEADDSKPITDADVLNFGPTGLHGLEIKGQPDDVASDAVATPGGVTKPDANSPATVETTSPVLKFGGREFKSAEELQGYLNGLDASQQDMLAKIFPVIKTDTKPPEDDFSVLAEKLFDKPAEALTELVEKITAKVTAKNEIETRKHNDAIAHDKHVTKTWDDFYTQNPDLKGFSEVVNAQYYALANSPQGNMDLKAGLKLVADKARERVAEQRELLIPKETLRSGPAITSGAGGKSVTKKAAPEVVVSLTQQLRGLQNKG